MPYLASVRQSETKLWSDKQKVYDIEIIILTYLSVWGGFYSLGLVIMFGLIH